MLILFIICTLTSATHYSHSLSDQICAKGVNHAGLPALCMASILSVKPFLQSTEMGLLGRHVTCNHNGHNELGRQSKHLSLYYVRKLCGFRDHQIWLWRCSYSHALSVQRHHMWGLLSISLWHVRMKFVFHKPSCIDKLYTHCLNWVMWKSVGAINMLFAYIPTLIPFYYA